MYTQHQKKKEHGTVCITQWPFHFFLFCNSIADLKKIKNGVVSFSYSSMEKKYDLNTILNARLL